MKEFKISVTESLQKIVTIEAENIDAAYTKAVDMYKEEKFVLTPEDHLETVFKLVEE